MRRSSSTTRICAGSAISCPLFDKSSSPARAWSRFALAAPGESAEAKSRATGGRRILTYFRAVASPRPAAPRFRRRRFPESSKNGDAAFRSARWRDLVQWRPHALARGEAPCPVTRLALRLRRLRRRARIWRQNLQVAAAFGAISPLRATAGLRDPLQRRGARRRQGRRRQGERHAGLLRAAYRLARQRDDGRRRATLDDPHGDR